MTHVQRFLLAGGLLLLIGAGVRPALAQDAAAGSFARNGFDARGIAMGNAIAADGWGNASPYYNPALAPYMAEQQLSASAAFMSMDRELQFLQFATPIQPSAGAALGLIHAGVTGIDGRDDSGYHTEDLSTDEFNLFLAFGNRFGERFSAGAALKLYQADYLDAVDPVITIGVDVGAHLQVTEQIHVGAVVSDLLANYSWDTSSAFEGGRSTTDRFPVRVRLAGAYRFMDGKARVTAEYESRFTPLEQRTRVPATTGGSPTTTFQTESLLVHGGRVRLGGSYRVMDVLALRGGLSRIGVDDTVGLRPSAGLGVRERVGNLDVEAGYAVVIEPYTRDGMHLLTLQIYL